MQIEKLAEKIIFFTKKTNRIRFPNNIKDIPSLAFQVNFPRLEIILDGNLSELCLYKPDNILHKNDVLYVPANSWNFSVWSEPASTLSILFGKQQIGFSIQRWDGHKLERLGRTNIARLGPRVGSYLLKALNEIIMQPADQKTASFIVNGLLSHCSDLLGKQIHTASRSRALFEAIREFIDDNFKSELTRESVANKFYISPNYLSHLFNKSGSIGFNEYLNHVRLEQAKEVLKTYDAKIKEIAHTCGFTDSNYFCCVFRKNTGCSPSEYRRQYHSH
ncbi:helix-turn-helix transcriptional regulator [Yersinia pekkanenii]|uniref:Transcriptional regulator n=1 Tax=Yersinia pekkanenii TaxID=1288385 RepID=A0A0T9NW96_9GAMM|nr:AraC family transcriptional regulator [Yersinia pekkanenii]CNH33638.1 putative transcriptional regulator [Yersinia pekkanenii]CRY62918.1 putative transcriptional regulator [Yersinia pekkanenii]